MRVIGDMVALKIIESEKEVNGILIPSTADKARTDAEVVAAGTKTKLSPGDRVVFNPDMRDYHDPESGVYFIRDYKISAVCR